MGNSHDNFDYRCCVVGSYERNGLRLPCHRCERGRKRRTECTGDRDSGGSTGSSDISCVGVW